MKDKFMNKYDNDKIKIPDEVIDSIKNFYGIKQESTIVEHKKIYVVVYYNNNGDICIRNFSNTDAQDKCYQLYKRLFHDAEKCVVPLLDEFNE